jgi:Archaeal Type IV pilin, N-terminal
VRSFSGMSARMVGRAPGVAARRRLHRHRTLSGHRAVSDVVATILLLALTVVLFSAIFAFVSAFPTPPPQNSNQFQATLVYNAGATLITGVNITHLAGPQVPTTGLIYFKSSSNPSACPFTAPVTIGSGVHGSVWTLGQTWSKQFSTFPGTGCSTYAGDPVGDNITVLILSQSNLIFSVVLPGQPIATPPAITATWTIPGTPSAGSAYRVVASVTGNLGGNKVYLSGAPGEAAAAQKMWFNSTAQYWQYNISNGNASTAGTYTGFVNVTSSLTGSTPGATATAPVTVVITATSNGPLSVAVVMSSQPPLAPAASVYFEAIVSYTGTGAGTLNVSFWPNETAASVTPLITTGTAIWGPTGLYVSGPATVTVFSYSPATWTVPGYGAYQVKASATVSGVGTAAGYLNFTTPQQYGKSAIYFTVAPSHTCSGNSCPYLEINFYNNWTTAETLTSGSFTIKYLGTTTVQTLTVTTPVTAQAWTKLVIVSSGRWNAFHTPAGSYSYTITFTGTFSGAAGTQTQTLTITV